MTGRSLVPYYVSKISAATGCICVIPGQRTTPQAACAGTWGTVLGAGMFQLQNPSHWSFPHLTSYLKSSKTLKRWYLFQLLLQQKF